ncbi:hypothetical protein LTR36_002261 [Oleoguttula mirabilis]|uniref:Uncharacterized protein n=1 Tax=Oleoguttula mirabilis TaxID=1507867 RepID=A0AAV9JLA9_9PEZI|nr:hypothetical protein LTR36_002261 [Oleoguttula mirabilis]
MLLTKLFAIAAALATVATGNDAVAKQLAEKSLAKHDLICHMSTTPADVATVSSSITDFCAWAGGWMLGGGGGGYILDSYPFSVGEMTFSIAYGGGPGTDLVVDQAICLNNMETIMNQCPAGSDQKTGGTLTDNVLGTWLTKVSDDKMESMRDTTSFSASSTFEIGSNAFPPPADNSPSLNKRTPVNKGASLFAEKDVDKRDLAYCYTTGTPSDAATVTSTVTEFCGWASGWVIGVGGYITKHYSPSQSGEISFKVAYLGEAGTSMAVDVPTCLGWMTFLVTGCQVCSDKKLGGEVKNSSSIWIMTIGQQPDPVTDVVTTNRASKSASAGREASLFAEKDIHKRGLTTSMSCFDSGISFNALTVGPSITTFCAWAKGKKVHESIYLLVDNIGFDIIAYDTLIGVKVHEKLCRTHLQRVMSQCQQGSGETMGGNLQDRNLIYGITVPATDKRDIDAAVAEDKRSPSAVSCYSTGYAVDVVTVNASIYDFCTSVSGHVVKPASNVAQEYGNSGGDVFLMIGYTGGTWTLTVNEDECISNMLNLMDQCPEGSARKLGGSVAGLDSSEYFLWTGQSSGKRSDDAYAAAQKGRRSSRLRLS